MTKNLRICFILTFIFSAIVMAWSTLSCFFGGVAINFVALLGIVFTILMIACSDRTIFNRLKDAILISCIFCICELVIYFACEYGYGEILKGFRIYQNIISFFGFIFFAYIGFRFWAEQTNKKYPFIETLLGNTTRKLKTKKKAKELSNGCLEEKPNNFHPMSNTSEIENPEEIEIIISDDEE